MVNGSAVCVVDSMPRVKCHKKGFDFHYSKNMWRSTIGFHFYMLFIINQFDYKYV